MEDNNLNNETDINLDKHVEEKTKFCKHCGQKIPEDAVICTKCGRQVEELKRSGSEQIIINNVNNNTAVATAITGTGLGRPKNKWIALLLCIFTVFGHKIYEGKIGMAIIYILTCGIFGIGWVIDIVSLLMKPNPYYV